ncbi:MAG: Gar1/Naf1 family protein [Candidatus Bathyarchaeia archaeon]
MQRVGRVLHVGSDKNLIIKAEKSLPRIGDRVVDEHLKPVGRVFDIFGPVATPYVTVRTQGKEPSYWINHILYFLSSSKPKKGKGTRRK